MADPAVQQYLMIAMALGQSPNTAIVDTSTQDYQASLSGEDLARAVYEVNICRYSQTVQQWLRGLAQVERVNAKSILLDDAIGDIQQAVDDAAAALAAASALAGLERRAVIRAPTWSATSVATGVGPQTHLPFPASTLQGSPLTRPTADFALASGVLSIDEPGVYRYSLRGSLTTGLLTAGAVRIYVAIGSDLDSGTPTIDYAAEHTVLVALLSTPAGIAGSGALVVPEGGCELALFGGHSALLATNLTLADVELMIERVGLLD